jgi:hypothetical protein
MRWGVRMQKNSLEAGRRPAADEDNVKSRTRLAGFMGGAGRPSGMAQARTLEATAGRRNHLVRKYAAVATTSVMQLK